MLTCKVYLNDQSLVLVPDFQHRVLFVCSKGRIIPGKLILQKRKLYLMKAPKCISLGAGIQTAILVGGCGLKYGAACSRRTGVTVYCVTRIFCCGDNIS